MKTHTPMILTAVASLCFCVSVPTHASSTLSAHTGTVQDPAWAAQASHDIRRSEYSFQPIAAGTGIWSAPNRSQELRSRVSCSGLEVFPRVTGVDGIGARWKLALRTQSLGRVDALHELHAPSISIRGNRAELDHGELVEWFENGENGIEHGYSIHERPLGIGRVWIGLEISGDLSLRIDGSSRSSALVDPRGQVQARYRDLVVFDATGRELHARLAPSPSGAGIEIDDAGAVYPVTVDPLLTGPAWMVESDQAFAAMGYSVSTAGDVNGDGYSDVVVGARDYDGGQVNAGRAFVYLGSSAGLATGAAWTAESDQGFASFGVSVATAGDVNGDGYSDVIIGAPFYANGESSEGRAFVYLGSSAGLATSVAWTAESNQAGAWLGESVATAGDVNGDGYSDVIIGAARFDNGQDAEGRAFVYLGSSTGLATSAAWTAESDQASAVFGECVAAAGDVNGDGFGDVIVGAKSYDNGQTDEGRAFVYMGSGSGLSASAAWTAESDQVLAFFGTSVSTAGDVNRDGYSDVIVGAPSYDNPESQEGRASVYLGSAGGLATSASSIFESDLVGATIGNAVATAGDVNGDGYGDVIVGASGYSNGQSNEGRAFVYLGSSTGLASSASWTAESDQAVALLGWRVATAGDVNGDGYSDVIVGAPYFDNGQTDEGRAYVYSGSSAGLATSAAWNTESDQANSSLGRSVATAGDVNGDGYSDVIVGAPVFDNGQTDEGRAFVFLGSSAGLATNAAWTAESDQAFGFFGWSVATAGDVNGDGYSDVIVSAYGYANGESNEGGSFVYLGSSTGLSTSAAWTAECDQADAHFGTSVASAGDVDGDGYGDVVIGADGFDNGQSNEGRAFVYLGSASGLATSPAWTAESDQASAAFGCAVGTAGDVNGDSMSDVIVGAYAHENGEPSEGRAFVYLGSSSGLATSAAWTAESDQAAAFFGISVGAAGDVNGDGFSDVIVGAFGHSNGQTQEGRAFVYQGSSMGLAASASWTAESDQAGAFFGGSTGSAGDVNGDGYSDVIVGAASYDDGQTNEGRAFVYLGSASGLATSAAWTAESNQSSAAFGVSVATAGDVDGDGKSDVIVGAQDYVNGRVGEGRAFVHLGNEGRGGWTLAPRQRQANDAAPIDLLGRSRDENEFRIRLDFERELTGFAWASGVAPSARLEWEVRPLRTPLDGSGVESGAELALTGSSMTFNELVEFVSSAGTSHPFGIAHHVAAGAYHWRVRLRTNNPVFPVTPWVSMPWNNISETKLRVGPRPAVRLAR